MPLENPGKFLIEPLNWIITAYKDSLNQLLYLV